MKNIHKIVIDFPDEVKKQFMYFCWWNGTPEQAVWLLSEPDVLWYNFEHNDRSRPFNVDNGWESWNFKKSPLQNQMDDFQRLSAEGFNFEDRRQAIRMEK